MNGQKHTVTHATSTYPSNLQTADDVSTSLKGVVSAERLRALADSGYAPHFRIDGGEAMFKLAEIKGWIADNLIKECAGGKAPRSNSTCLFRRPDFRYIQSPGIDKVY